MLLRGDDPGRDYLARLFGTREAVLGAAQATGVAVDGTTLLRVAVAIDLLDTLGAVGLGLCHAGCKPAFLREAYRMLRPVVEDYARRDEPLRPGERTLMDRWLDGWVIPGLAATGEFATWAAEAGFTDIAVRDTGAGARRSLRRLDLVSLASIPLLYVSAA